MKKLITFVAVLAILLPFSAMAAMTSISDSEMAEVTGQVGIDIAIEDFNMDLYIETICWGDADIGSGPTAKLISGKSVNYTAGYINLYDLQMPNIYVSMNGSPVFANGAVVGASTVLMALGGVKNYVWLAAEPLKIDVSTSGSQNEGSLNPFYSSQGKTAISITLPDAYIFVEKISLAGIYLDSVCNLGTYDFLAAGEKWLPTSSAPASSKNLGTLAIAGVTVYTYSSVAKSTYIAGLDTVTTGLTHGDYYRSAWRANAGTDGNPVRYYPGHEARLIITAH